MPQKKTILLVEDNIHHAYLIARLLEEHRLVDHVDHIGDGEEALAYLMGHAPASTLPDLILLDLRLPKVSGLEILREVKATCHLRGIPVIMLTTSHHDADAAAAYALRANGYLVKPEGLDAFAEMLRSTVHYWLAWNHPLHTFTTEHAPIDKEDGEVG